MIGFTGTRNGLSARQRVALKLELAHTTDDSFMHGDCVGADAEAHQIAKDQGKKVYIRPSHKGIYRADCQDYEHRYAMASYLKLNRAIVKDCDLLLACPGEKQEQQRGGTWYTIRQAKNARVPVIIIFPDGEVWEDQVSCDKSTLVKKPLLDRYFETEDPAKGELV
jgi:hypothetical protein